MHQNRKPPSKRYSSYVPPTEISTLGDQVSSLSGSCQDSPGKEGVNMRTASVSAVEKTTRRKSLNTLHFDALQNAVSKLSRIDDYDLEELGYGFFSDVFKVTHKQSGKVMVLKRNKNTNTKMNILREVQLMNRLAHPNILKFNGVCVHEGQLHALTEFINGGDLDQLVQQKSTNLTWSVRIRLALDVSKGLMYLHSMGIFHRDLTAKNCLVRVTTNPGQKKKYSAVVADLGLAEKIPTKPEDKTRMRIVGTPYYMAPEVLHEKPYDERSDFFSFGIIFCQLIIRTSSDPEKLPRSNDFGLQKDLFTILVKKGVGAPEPSPGTLPLSMPPNGFLQLAYDLCEVDPENRPDLKDIVRRLEESQKEEKGKRVEQKRLLLLKEQSKQHSSVLTELPSLGSLKENSQISISKFSRVADGDKENSIPSKSSVATLGECRSSTSVISNRLSRSSSDITKELISHAASIIALSQNGFSSDTDDFSLVISSLNEAFTNPFSMLEKSELKERKLIDLPSSQVLEMTFDLPTPKLSSGSPPIMRRKNTRNLGCPRPRSLMLDTNSHDHTNHFGAPQSPRAVTPEPYRSSRKHSNLRGINDTNSSLPNSCPPSPIPQLLSPVEVGKTQYLLTFQRRLKQALIRSVALSPQGRRLLSWWHTHSRTSDWRSLTSLLSVMSDKMGTLKKSISVPDLSRYDGSLFVLTQNAPTSNNSSMSSVSSDIGSPRSSISGKPPLGSKIHPHFYPSYATLPRKKKSRCQSSSADLCRKRRSKTSDDVFSDLSQLEILPEETTDPKPTVSPSSAPSTPSQGPTSLVAEINNNSESRIPLKTQYTNSISSCPCNDSYSPPLEKIVDSMGVKMSSGNPAQASSVESTLLDDNASSSSSSSGASMVGLQMTLQTGAVSSNRRRRVGFQSPPFHPSAHIPPSQSSWSNLNDDASYQKDSNDNRVGHFHPRVYSPIEDQCLSPRSNRDSGYNDDYFSTDHSCDSQSSHDTVDSGVRIHRTPNLKSALSKNQPLTRDSAPHADHGMPLCLNDLASIRQTRNSKSVSFKNEPCSPRDSTPHKDLGMPLYSNKVAPIHSNSKSTSFKHQPYSPRDSTQHNDLGMPLYLNEVVPRCKVKDNSDAKVSLIGKTH